MNRSKQLLTIGTACAIGFAFGHLSSDAPVNAEVRRSAPRATFESGSERSLATLDVIARHLKSIDERVARIERSVATKPGRAPAPQQPASPSQ